VYFLAKKKIIKLLYYNISSASIIVKDNDMNNSIELAIFISKLKDLGFEVVWNYGL